MSDTAYHIVWTAIPAGLRPRLGADHLRLLAFVTPKIHQAGKLEDFPDIANWPETLDRHELRIHFGDSLTLSEGMNQVDRTLRGSKNERLRLWRTLFPPDIPVEAFGQPGQLFMEAQPKLHSFDVEQAEQKLLAYYFKAGELLANGERLTAAFTDPHDAVDPVPSFYEPLDGGQRQDKRHEFHEFHQRLSLLGSYPELLRYLGLLVELSVELPEGLENGLVSISTTAPAGSRSLRTRYQLDTKKKKFFTSEKSEDPTISDGMLRLKDASLFGLTQLDVDGTSLALANWRAVRKQRLDSSSELSPPPAPRSHGFGIIFKQRQKNFEKALARATFLDSVQHGLVSASSAEATLGAEALVRGYRLDVHDGRRWHSLSEVDLKLEVRAADWRWGPERQEGWSESHVRSGQQDSAPVVRLHQVVVRWDGWSICAPRPGVPADNRDPCTEKAPLEASLTAAEGSLPRLRFGQRYRFRVRTVDLAGQSVPFDEGDLEGQSELVGTHRRFEQVRPPVMVPPRLFDTNHREVTAECLIIRSFNDSIEKDRAPSEGVDHRIISPPVASVGLAELHGLLDGNGPWKSRGGFKGYERLKKLDLGRPSDMQGTLPPVIGYLPDPMAHGAYLTQSKGSQEPISVSFPFYGASHDYKDRWPEAQPFMLELREPQGTGSSLSVKTDLAERKLTVFLPKGMEVELELTSAIRQDCLALFGFRNLVSTAASNEETAASQVLVAHPMLTPERRLRLIHAVQQPLGTLRLSLQPEAGELGYRPKGETHVVMNVVVSQKTEAGQDLSADKLGRVYLEASWEEPQDDLTENPKDKDLEWRPDRSRSFTSHVSALENLSPSGLRIRHALDQRHRWIRYTVVAESPFQAHFEKGTQVSRRSNSVEINVYCTFQPPPPEVAYVMPSFKLEPPSAPDTSSLHQRGGLRIYVRRPWFKTGEGEQLQVRWRTSQWGADPIREAGSLPPFPEPPPGVSVESANFTLTYDRAQDLWYADVLLNTYTDVLQNTTNAIDPFVQFEVCRFQPSAESHLQTSPPVFCQIAQVLPDRGVTITHNPGGTWTIDFWGPGLSAAAGGAPLGVEVKAVIQERLSSASEPEGEVWCYRTIAPRFGIVTGQPDRVRSYDLRLPLPLASGVFRAVIIERERGRVTHTVPIVLRQEY